MNARSSVDSACHARLVAEDAAAGDGAGWIDAEDCEALAAVVSDVHAQGVDEGAFADSGDAGDADAAGLAGVGQNRVEQELRPSRCPRPSRFQSA